jgi:hypothetical protein
MKLNEKQNIPQCRNSSKIHSKIVERDKIDNPNTSAVQHQ